MSEQKKEHNILAGIKMWGSLFMTLCMLLAFTASTYAWFTNSRVVKTNRVASRTNEDDVTLELSSTGGNDFKSGNVAEIKQINTYDNTALLPVSTSDLKSFLYCPNTNGGNAEKFVLVKNEANYYHGRFYMRATSKYHAGSDKLSVYFDEAKVAGGILVTANEGNLLNAARLGLTFDGGDPYIFKLSNSSNKAADQVRNTKLNGVILGDDNVLTYRNGKISGVKDPAVKISDYRIEIDDSVAKLPDKPLLEMTLNKIYTVDVYFYLEGCDPDCSDSIHFDAADLHLAFYGIIMDQ